MFGNLLELELLVSALIKANFAEILAIMKSVDLTELLAIVRGLVFS